MILCTGCFDGLHAGHVRYLHLARLISPHEELVVAVAHDEYIGETKARRSLWCQLDRGETVAAIRDVDRVICQGPGSVASVIIEEKPRIVVKGIDWAGKLPPDVQAAADSVGAIVVYVNAEGDHVEDVLARYAAENSSS